MKVSVIISARNEFPNIVHTVHAIINDLETFLSRDEFEIIIVDNGSTDELSWRFLAERGVYYHRTVRILFDPIMGNVSARNKGAKIAKGKYIFFSDAHMSYRIGSFKAMVDALEKYGGIVHPSVQWMGGYDPSGRSYQYSIKLGEKIWGTWNNLQISENPFYIPISGHCCLGVEREQFLKWGGYNPFFRCYGGGEVYLDMKWWMIGSSVMVVPQAVGYHLSAGRGYFYMQDDFIHNMMLLAQALGADAMAERVYLRYLAKVGVSSEKITKLRDEARNEALQDALELVPRVSKTFYECITDRPWDERNIALHGKASSGILIYDRTWTESLSGDARAIFDSSPLQAELQKLIDGQWSQWVYKGTL
jgi:glycosyltransferase involved in cell wall biosynthesis